MVWVARCARCEVVLSLMLADLKVGGIFWCWLLVGSFGVAQNRNHKPEKRDMERTMQCEVRYRRDGVNLINEIMENSRDNEEDSRSV